MTDHDQANRRIGAAGEKDYQAGYGKPPKHTQFQKGISGKRLTQGLASTSLDEAALALKEAVMFQNVSSLAGRQRSSGERCTRHLAATWI
ncbi:MULTISPECIES: hypothetical protein [unclassified Bradyrhizobium]|uniref:hypothetical protein n=1 Tax=unclassified Bradyrhizobium TaxID=2631580 RepID=UPI001FF9BCFE|nr:MULTISPECIES: hypothetical protein [unclassified Bradyrhizobium]